VQTVRTETGRDLHHVVVGLEDGGGSDSRCSTGDTGFDVAVSTRPDRDPSGASASAVSELIFTSGTEATPKAIMHTEQTANFSVRVAYDDLALDEQAVVWMPSPIGHSTGFNYGVRFALFHGRPLVLQDRWDVDVALDLIEHERCSYTLAATTFLQDLVAASVATGRALPTLTHFGCGGAPVPRELVRAALDRGIRVLRLYGSTEVLVGSWNRPSSTFDQRAGTDGVAMSHVEFEIRDPDGGRCRPGEPGEAFVRGPNTCVGFFGDPERTAATFDDEGWVATGDLLVEDDDGYFSVVGRRKEIIIRGGLNIAPREIEDLLLGFPEVERAAVVGLPDERLGERMCACVVLRDGTELDLAGAVERLRGLGLATYKLPERLEVVEALPSTPSGKIQKHLLVAELTR
jgi:acyl-CoA synthetase (AMP-forming)/AMP-acid ligase II